VAVTGYMGKSIEGYWRPAYVMVKLYEPGSPGRTIQPVELVVIRDAATKQKLAESGVRPAAGAAVAFVIVTPGDPAAKEREAFDDGRLVERLLLAAKAHQLGANVGSLKGDGPTVIKQWLGIPSERRVWSVVTIGHTDEEARRARAPGSAAGRKALDEFAHWDRYPN